MTKYELRNKIRDFKMSDLTKLSDLYVQLREDEKHQMVLSEIERREGLKDGQMVLSG